MLLRVIHYKIILLVVTLSFLPKLWAIPGSTTKQVNDDLIELVGSSKPISEEDLYSQIIERYRRNDILGLHTRARLFHKKFPRSVHADNVLYLCGLNELQNREFGPSIKFFNRILKEYPRSSKVVSAKFAKAMAYKKMNLPGISSGLLKEVAKSYKGSPESLRAAQELKMLR